MCLAGSAVASYTRGGRLKPFYCKDKSLNLLNSVKTFSKISNVSHLNERFPILVTGEVLGAAAQRRSDH